MARDFSVIRRRANLVDLLTPIQAGVDGYRLDTATNFDGSYTARATATVSGYLDPALAPRIATLPTINNTNQVRFTFDPATFSLDDKKQFWIRLTPVTSGTPGTSGAGLAVETYKTGNRPIVLVAGAAPSGAAVANSLEVNLPGNLTMLSISNRDASNSLFVAFEVDGPELEVIKASTYQQYHGNASVLFVRGSGGIVNFQVTGTYPYGI